MAVLLLRRLSRIYKVLLARRCLAADFVHLLARASFDAVLLGVDVGIEAGFGSHYFFLAIGLWTPDSIFFSIAA